MSLFGDNGSFSPAPTRGSKVTSSGGLFSDEDTDEAIDQSKSPKPAEKLFPEEDGDLFDPTPNMTPPTKTKCVPCVYVCACVRVRVCDMCVRVMCMCVYIGRSQLEQCPCLEELICLVVAYLTTPHPPPLPPHKPRPPRRPPQRVRDCSQRILMVTISSPSHLLTRRSEHTLIHPHTHSHLHILIGISHVISHIQS